MFSNGSFCKNVTTVAEAIKELSLLPPEMRLDQDYDGCGTDIVVMNKDEPETCHVHFAQGGDWDQDATPPPDDF